MVFIKSKKYSLIIIILIYFFKKSSSNNKAVTNKCNETEENIVRESHKGLFTLEVRVRSLIKPTNKSILDFGRVETTAFCTVFENKIYIISREYDIRETTHFVSLNLFEQRKEFENFVNHRRHGRLRDLFCDLYVNTSYLSYMFHYKSYVHAIDFEGKRHKVKLAKDLHYLDLLIFEFEDQSAINSQDCLRLSPDRLREGQKVILMGRNKYAKRDLCFSHKVVGMNYFCSDRTPKFIPLRGINVDDYYTDRGAPILDSYGQVVGTVGYGFPTYTLDGYQLQHIIQNYHYTKTGLQSIQGVRFRISWLINEFTSGALVTHSDNPNILKEDIVKECNGIKIKDTQNLFQELIVVKNQGYNYVTLKIERNEVKWDVIVKMEEINKNDVLSYGDSLSCGGYKMKFSEELINLEHLPGKFYRALDIRCPKPVIDTDDEVTNAINKIRESSFAMQITLNLFYNGRNIGRFNSVGGSGFLVKGKSGKLYLATNDHVISHLLRYNTTYNTTDIIIDSFKKYLKTRPEAICFENNTLELKVRFKAITRYNKHILVKSPVLYQNSFAVLDHAFVEFVNETQVKHLMPLEFTADEPVVKQTIATVGNTFGYRQVSQWGHIENLNYGVVCDNFLGRYHISCMVYKGASGSAIVRLDSKVIGMNGVSEIEGPMRYSIRSGVYKKLLEDQDQYGRMMIFYPAGVVLEHAKVVTIADENKFFSQVPYILGYELKLEIGDEIIKCNNRLIKHANMLLEILIYEAKNFIEGNYQHKMFTVSMEVMRNGKRINLSNVLIKEMSREEIIVEHKKNKCDWTVMEDHPKYVSFEKLKKMVKRKIDNEICDRYLFEEKNIKKKDENLHFRDHAIKNTNYAVLVAFVILIIIIIGLMAFLKNESMKKNINLKKFLWKN